ncbi:MAG: M16 family metallopeptidase [Candidatus Hydrogenedentota bacterium]
MSTRLLIGAAIAAASFCQPTSAEVEERVHDYEIVTLENGLRVVTVEDFSTPLTAVHVWYHVGAKDEDPERQGFAHMFEHMMFRGTDRVEPEEHFERIREVGGSANAFTSFDYTAYVNTVPSNQLELALWLEADRMMFLDVNQEHFVTERRVVEEERRQYLNRPYGTVFEEILPVLFEDRPYRWHPIGNIEHLRAAALRELQDFWDTYYLPNNAVVAIVGAVSHEDAQEKARKYFGWMPRGPEPPRPEKDAPEQEEERDITIEERLGPVPQLNFFYRGVPRKHADYAPLRILMNVLGYGNSSRLYEDLVRDKGAADSVSASAGPFEVDGYLRMAATLQPGQDLDEILSELDEHVENVREEPISERELTKVQNQLMRNAISGLFRMDNRARELGQATLELGHPEGLNEELEAIRSVTPEDVLRVAQEYLTPAKRTVVRVVPEPDAEPHPDVFLIADEEGAQEVAGEETETEPTGVKAEVTEPDHIPDEPPMADLISELPETEVEETELDNGLRLAVIEDDRLPYVQMKLGLRYGAWAEDPETPGAASMAMAMLTRGTENYTASELAEQLEYNAISLSGSADMDTATVNASGLSDKIETAFELMAEVVRRPTFPEEEFKTVQRQRISSRSVDEEDPGYLADRALRQQLFEGHPYARSPRGELEDIEALTAETARDWWETYMRPDAAVLYVAGDVTTERARELAEAEFGGWEAEGERPPVELPGIPEKEDTQIYVVDRPGSVQSQIRVGQPTITRGHPDYHKAQVFTQVYGASSASRLFQVVRAERGLTYGVRGLIRPQLKAGNFWTYTFTQTANTAETLASVLEVLDSMREEPPTDEELESARSYLMGNLPTQMESLEDVVNYQWIFDYYDQPRDYLQKALEEYQETTREDVMRIAEEVIDPDSLCIVVVGEADAFLDDLKEIAPVTVVEEVEETEEPPMPEDMPAPDPDAPLETP